MITEEQFTPRYLAQLKPNCLRLATRNLGRQGFRTFCPLEHHTRRRNERFETSFRPLFPGYLFVQFDPMTTAWRAISHTHGVSRLVTFEPHRPAEILQALVSELMNRCDETGRLRPPAVLKAVDRVQINAGPFADFIATVESLHPDRQGLSFARSVRAANPRGRGPVGHSDRIECQRRSSWHRALVK